MTSPLFGPVHIRGELQAAVRTLIGRVNTLPKGHPLRQRLGNIHGNATLQTVISYAVELLLESIGNNPEAWRDISGSNAP